MNRSHQFEICRALYQQAREAGSPAVILRNLSGLMCGETSDGRVLMEGVSGCCAWAMKYKVANQWIGQNDQ